MAGKSSLQRGMEEAPKNSKESSHSAHANGYKSLVPKVTSQQLKYYNIYVVESMKIVFTYSFCMPSKCSCLFVDLCSTGKHEKRTKQIQ